MTEERGLDPERVAEIRAMEDQALVDDVVTLRRALKLTEREVRMREVELVRRMEDRGGPRVNGSAGHVDLKYGSPSYDVATLKPLLERLTDAEVAESYTPEGEETIVRPIMERWHGAKLNMYERRYGGAVAEIIQQARTYGPPFVAVTDDGDD